jgi:hypothetical protein
VDVTLAMLNKDRAHLQRQLDAVAGGKGENEPGPEGLLPLKARLVLPERLIFRRMILQRI